MYSQKAHFWVESISIFVTCPFLKLEHTELITVLEILFFSVYIDITSCQIWNTASALAKERGNLLML